VDIARRRSLMFVLLVIAISTIFYVPIIRHGMATRILKLSAVFWMMWSPAISAVIVSIVTKKNWREFGWRLPKAKYLLAGWLVPVAYAALVYAAVWLTKLGAVPNPKFVEGAGKFLHMEGKPDWMIVAAAFVAIATVATLFSCLSAAGEEIGWRGFWVPELTAWLGFRRAALVSGAFWAVWHMPAILFADYNSNTPKWFEVPCFAAMVMGIAVFYAWMRLKSASVWPCVLLHASHNAIIQGFFDGVTVNTGHTLWWTTEFGIALVIPAVSLALWAWKRNPQAQPEMITSATVASASYAR